VLKIIFKKELFTKQPCLDSTSGKTSASRSGGMGFKYLAD